ncbi:MAG: SPOR domain-containing protein [Deltaproteobacteria bacterium]|nr:SPOR domain-containing protein [Deltaproteobacteria bacterium]
MLLIIRNLIFRFWISLITGGLIALWALPLFSSHVSLGWMLLPAMTILFLIFLFTGWLLNLYGTNIVESLISEAAILESAGRHNDAEGIYKKAVAVFDSFILSYLGKKRSSARLVAYMARFYLARAEKKHGSEAFIISYLESHPEDSEAAENWLQQIKNRPVTQKEHQELLFLIGNSQQDNMSIQNTLARLYLSAERSDFPALQTYRRVLKSGGKDAKHIIVNLSTIFRNDGRADEWALEIYLQAYQIIDDKSNALKGIAACVHWMTKSDSDNKLLHKAKELLFNINEDQLKKMRQGFNPPIVQTIKKKPSSTFKTGWVFFKMMIRVGAWLYCIAQSVVSSVFYQGTRLIQFAIYSRRSKQVLRWMFTMVLASGIILLVINTVGHLVKTKISSGKNKVDEIVVTDPFTLQVAAYLKPEHAEKYVASLKKNKLDAYWNEAVGGTKKWYQVRVSHFADKASARAYGESLKTRGIIDDFFVANYP